MKVIYLIERKQIKAMNTIKLQIQQNTEAIHTSSAKLKMKTTHSAKKLINTLFCTRLLQSVG